VCACNIAFVDRFFRCSGGLISYHSTSPSVHADIMLHFGYFVLQNGSQFPGSACQADIEASGLNASPYPVYLFVVEVVLVVCQVVLQDQQEDNTDRYSKGKSQYV